MTRQRSWLALAGIALTLAGCGRDTRIASKPPEVLPGQEPDTVPALAPTYAKAPLTVDLGPLLSSLEQRVPRHFGDLEKKVKVHSLAKAAVEIWRGPLEITFDSNAVHLRMPFEYAAKAWGPLGVFIGSCGVKEARPRAVVTAVSRFELRNDWRLHTTSKVDLAPGTDPDRDKCKLSAANVDITKLAFDGAEGAANGAMQRVDERVAQVRLEDFIGKYWLELQKPIKVMDSTLWLTLNPEGVGVGTLVVRDSVVHVDLSVRASPRMLSGPRPAPGAVPLPPFVGAVGDNVLIGLVEGRMAYEDLNRLLQSKVAGKPIPVGWRRTRIERVETSYVGEGRVAIGVELAGRVEGQVWFVGRPVLDTARHVITVPDLELDVNSASGLVQGASWVAGDKLRDYLRQSIVISSKDLIDKARELANKELTRDLSPDVKMIGHLDSARALAVRAAPEGFVARARAVGQIGLDITAPSAPPVQKKRPAASAE